MIDEKIIKQAHNNIIPLGYKPEDYAIFGDDIAKRIAVMVVREAIHIQKMNNYRKRKLFNI